MSSTFHYELKDGDDSRTFRKLNNALAFDPPVYEMRYMVSIRILEDKYWRTDFKKVIDFGCAELQFAARLRRLESIENIVAVDIDELLLKNSLHRVEPLISDHLNKRERPLRIEVHNGSIESPADCLRKADAVIALEILEHLNKEVLDKIPQNIFGFIQPKLAIFSTPNVEFNVLFGPLLDNGFRHLDHKFEWTRAEFKKWALDVCKRFPNYKVTFIGVGKPPPDQNKVGFVTQIAIFARLDILREKLAEPLQLEQEIKIEHTSAYKLVHAVDFPYNLDERTREQKILHEINYAINCNRRVRRYFNREREIYQIPFKIIWDTVAPLAATKDEIERILLEAKYNLEGDFVVLPEFDDDEPAYDDCMEFVGSEICDRDAEEDEELCSHRAEECSQDSEEDWD